MGAPIPEQRSYPRARVNWRVEYTGTSESGGVVHEGSRLQDYSSTGACFLTMADVAIGMDLMLHISLPVRMARPLVLKGRVVRVDDRADVCRMFKAAAVRWLPAERRPDSSDRAKSQSVLPAAH